VTHGCLRAHAAKHGPLSVVQIDAHTDTWEDDDPKRVDLGTFMRKAVDEGLVDDTRSVQVGIRTDNPDPMGFTILDARHVHRQGPEAVATQIKQIVGDHPVYLTFDIDGLDPAFAPGTGTPVWGGLTSHQAAVLLRDLAGINLVGGDVVEVSPPFDTTGATAVMAAHVATEILSLWGWTRRMG
jgi:agmatinase